MSEYTWPIRNRPGNFTEYWKLYQPKTGETGWGTDVDFNFKIIDDHLGNKVTELKDVTLTSPSTSHILQYKTNHWANVPLTFGNHSDTSIAPSDLVNGAMLRYTKLGEVGVWKVYPYLEGWDLDVSPVLGDVWVYVKEDSNNPDPDAPKVWRPVTAPFLKLDGSNGMTNHLDVGTHRIINLSDPVSQTDALNKRYFDENKLNLGESETTAYRGDRGKTAYDHTFLTDNPHTVTKTQIGLENVTNDAQIPLSYKGAISGVAELGADGKVPASQLPSYVDDVEEYTDLAAFPATGEASKIYIDLATNLTYRWSGTVYANIGSPLALGETSTTAYRGDRGKTAYDHSQVAHAPANAQKNSDITKGEIEAQLTGTVTSHNHAGTYQPLDADLTSIANLSDPIGHLKKTAANTWSLDTTVYVDVGQKGVALGVASLGSDGKIPSSQLPNYLDSVAEYANFAAFPATGESGTLYIALDTQITYRWSGTAYIEVSASLALGETISTAYRGDRGKTAYDHSQLPHDYSASSHTHTGTYQPLDTDLTTLAGFTLANNAHKIIAVNTGETTYELVSGESVVLPNQTGKARQVLTTDGTNSVWGVPVTINASPPTTPYTGELWVDTGVNINLAPEESDPVWGEITIPASNALVNGKYVINCSSLCTMSLPTTIPFGSTIQIVGKSSSKWKIAQNANQVIRFGNVSTTVGAGGSITAGSQYDTIELLCITENTEFVVTYANGTLEVI